MDSKIIETNQISSGNTCRICSCCSYFFFLFLKTSRRRKFRRKRWRRRSRNSNRVSSLCLQNIFHSSILFWDQLGFFFFFYYLFWLL